MYSGAREPSFGAYRTRLGLGGVHFPRRVNTSPGHSTTTHLLTLLAFLSPRLSLPSIRPIHLLPTSPLAFEELEVTSHLDLSFLINHLFLP